MGVSLIFVKRMSRGRELMVGIGEEDALVTAGSMQYLFFFFFLYTHVLGREYGRVVLWEHRY